MSCMLKKNKAVRLPSSAKKYAASGFRRSVVLWMVRASMPSLTALLPASTGIATFNIMRVALFPVNENGSAEHGIVH